MTYGGVAEKGFAIDPVTGVISATRALDREEQDHYTVTGNPTLGEKPLSQCRDTGRTLGLGCYGFMWSNL